MKDRPAPLDEFEASWMEAIEKDQVVSDPAAVKRLKGAMTLDPSLKDTTPISLRLSKGDLSLLKVQAEQEGLPYQTYIKSVLHKLAVGSFVLRPR